MVSERGGALVLNIYGARPHVIKFLAFFRFIWFQFKLKFNANQEIVRHSIIQNAKKSFEFGFRREKSIDCVLARELNASVKPHINVEFLTRYTHQSYRISSKTVTQTIQPLNCSIVQQKLVHFNRRLIVQHFRTWCMLHHSSRVLKWIILLARKLHRNILVSW